MNFIEDKAIYLQIIDYICEQILSSRWKVGDRILSVREFGAALEVNPNTVLRSYNELMDREILYKKRGIGYFVADGAIQKIRTEQKHYFLTEECPKFFKKMQLLGLSFQDLETCIESQKQ